MAFDIPTDEERQAQANDYLKRVREARALQHAAMASAKAGDLPKPQETISHYYELVVAGEATQTAAKAPRRRQAPAAVPA